uniref:Uncharacterized protein n=1 Tax=Micrurus corallinus TaxID=54390 RepID=A0A2D4FYQ5_MICCO
MTANCSSPMKTAGILHIVSHLKVFGSREFGGNGNHQSRRNTGKRKEDPTGADGGQTGNQREEGQSTASQPSLSGNFSTCTGGCGGKRTLGGFQHQQVLGECSEPSGLLASSSSSTTFSGMPGTLICHLFQGSSSLCAKTMELLRYLSYICTRNGP